MKVGQIVKLNSEIFPANNTNERLQAGKLNYFAGLLKYDFEVVRVFEDHTFGKMIEVKGLDPIFTGNPVFIIEDCKLKE